MVPAVLLSIFIRIFFRCVFVLFDSWFLLVLWDNTGGEGMIFHFLIVQVYFVFLFIEFHCAFSILIKDYNIMFIIIVF